MADETDVVVVGAGMSGLIAARDLQRAGVRVLVLESAERCGGRTLSETTALGSRLDLGGQWIGHDHHRLIALADEVGATRFTMHTAGMPRFLDGERRIRPTSAAFLRAVAQLVKLDLVRRTGRPDRWAQVSAQDWLDQAPASTRRLLDVVAAISWTADLRRLSVPTILNLITRQHGLITMLSTKGGAQDALIAEGVGFLTDHIVAELDDAVRTGTRVTGIDRDEAGATVRTTSGSLRTRRVVIAAPPPTAARIAHTPALPAARADLEQHSFMGSVYKAIAVYPEPFWRPSSSGELFFLDEPGCATFDSSAPGGPGHLTLLIGGPDAESVSLLEPEVRRRLLLGRIATQLGPQALDPVDWREKSWQLDEHAAGGYLAVPELGAEAPGMPMDATPVGCVHWAGSETAEDHPGYIDGAIEAGQRAAREVIAALS